MWWIILQRTIFTTPIVRHFFFFISWVGLKLSGWKLEGEAPKEKKYVIVAAPHTTNWDFPITLAMCFLFRVKIVWMGKASLFKGVLGPIMRFCGGIAIDRSKSNNTVDQIVSKFNMAEELILAIPVEGTRAQVDRWRTGFYFIADGAKVPLGRAFLDYGRKVGGFMEPFYPTGNLELDLQGLQKSYEGIVGLYKWVDGEKTRVKRLKHR